MRKYVVAALLAASTASYAAFNLNIDTQYLTAMRPNTGFVDVTFTGTIDILISSFDVDYALLEFPSDGSNFLSGSFDAGFITYLSGSSPGVDYSGNLFTITVNSIDNLGLYWLNSSSGGFSSLSEFVVGASSGDTTAFDNEMYGVEVVPEPASLAAVALGLAALARRRRKA